MALFPLRIGTAGWALPAKVREDFPDAPSNLARYAGRLDCAEINSSFYRSHKRETYANWARSTPERFRFAVKLPKTITHERRLADCAALVASFAEQTSGLGRKRAVILAQLPPTLMFDAALVERFFALLGKAVDCAIVCEPRHPSWADAPAEALLKQMGVARVAADPPRFGADADPAGARRIAYYRLHGSPRLYFGDYDDGRLGALYARIAARRSRNSWVIFDNTASGAAAANALALAGLRDKAREG